MSGPLKGYPSISRDLSLQPKDVHITASPVRTNQVGLDVIAHVYMYEVDAPTLEAGSTTTILNLTGHAAERGDVIRFTSGALLNAEARVLETTANTITLIEAVSAAPSTDDIQILRNKYPTTDEFGNTNVNINEARVAFDLDGASQVVTEDTVTPANNRPLPVKLSGITGDINITANDLNVQLQHTGATPDSVQIGDGTEILLINAGGEALVHDQDTHDKLDTANASLATIAGDTTSIDAKVSTEAKQDTIITSLSSIDAELVLQTALLTTIDADTSSIDTKLTTTNSTLADIEATLTNIESDTAALVLVDYATSAKQDAQTALLTTIDADTGSIDTKLTSTNALLTSLDGKDFSTETTLSAFNSKFASFDLDTGGGTETNAGVNLRISEAGGSVEAKGQKAMASSIPVAIASDQSTLPISAASLPLPTGAATEATLSSIDGKDFATETTLAALNAKVTAVDTTGKATEAKQDSAIALLTTIDADTGSIDTSTTAIASDISDLNTRLAGSLVPSAFDYIALTYVAAGNGEGEIETATYKTGGAAGSTVATLTLAYDSSNRISSVTKT